MILKKLVFSTVLIASMGLITDIYAEGEVRADLTDASSGLGYGIGQFLVGQARRRNICNPKDRTIFNAFFESSVPGILGAVVKSVFKSHLSKYCTSDRREAQIFAFLTKLAAASPKAFSRYNKALKDGQEYKTWMKSWACTNENLKSPITILLFYLVINGLKDKRALNYIGEESMYKKCSSSPEFRKLNNNQDGANAVLRFELRSKLSELLNLFDEGDLTIPLAHDKNIAIHVAIVKFIVWGIVKASGVDEKGFKADVIKSTLIPTLITASLNPKIAKWVKMFTGQAEEDADKGLALIKSKSKKAEQELTEAVEAVVA